MKTLLILTTVILLTSCATTPQTDTPKGVCDDHGGVHSISSDRPHVDVYCRDGTYQRNWK